MKKRSLFAIACIVAIVFITSFKPGTDTIQLDGVINDSEWKDAKQYDLSGGGSLLMKKKNNDLYLALIAEKKGWAHVYLSHKDTIRVLHASAALGEARYVKKNNLWQGIQSFKWELRDRIYNNDLAKKQQQHYEQFGWVANNNNTGNGMIFEFKLDLSRADNNPAPLACVVIQEPLELHYFPVSLSDNTILQRLVQGYTPDSLHFNPGSWEKIR